MSNDKVVRPDGWYLGKWGEYSRLTIYYVYCGRVSEMGGYFDPECYHWIADEPLDLECIKLLQMNGGLQNAVELVKKDAIVDKVVSYE